jgi:hypothetical protein
MLSVAIPPTHRISPSSSRKYVLTDGSRKEELRAMKRLLRELDVADDGTTSKILQTRDQFRDAYGLEPGPLQLTS